MALRAQRPVAFPRATSVLSYGALVSAGLLLFGRLPILLGAWRDIIAPRCCGAMAPCTDWGVRVRATHAPASFPAAYVPPRVGQQLWPAALTACVFGVWAACLPASVLE